MTTSYRSPTLSRLARVFVGADAGHYDLPVDVQAVRTALDRLRTEQNRAATDPTTTTEHDLVDEITEAAKAGKRFPTAAALERADQERRTRERYRSALARAAEGMEDQLEAVVVSCAERLVVEHLRPALADLLAELTQVAAALDGRSLDPAALLDAPDEARQARRRLDALADRYEALRGAQSTLAAVSPAADDNGRYAEVRNYDELVVGYRPGKTPWPDDTIGKLRWFAANGADVWMPTTTERCQLAEEAAERSTLRPSALLIPR